MNMFIIHGAPAGPLSESHCRGVMTREHKTSRHIHNMWYDRVGGQDEDERKE